MQGALTPRGRIDGLGWVKPQEDENLENALNALTYPDPNHGMLNNWVSCNITCKAVCMDTLPS